MEENNVVILADHPGLGRVWDCGECGNIHVSIGPVTVSLEPPAYLALVNMLASSASNFESWLEQCRNAVAEVDLSLLRESNRHIPGEAHPAPPDSAPGVSRL
jgi:hypothetical protein